MTKCGKHGYRLVHAKHMLYVFICKDCGKFCYLKKSKLKERLMK